MDRRLTAFSGRVAHAALRGQVDAEVFVQPEPWIVGVPITDLCAAPEGARDRQLLFGAPFSVIEWRDGSVFGMAADGYCGWLVAEALAPWVAPTHWVCAPATHLYPAPSVKAPAGASLSLGAMVCVMAQSGAWMQEAGGRWLPAPHLRALEDRPPDPVAVAESLLGTPYLWGGNSRWGIDCSGLVQMSCLACGLPSPADSDMQAAGLGDMLAFDALPKRGDLVFWKGHVGWMADSATLLHANAYHMAVVSEPFDTARARILSAGGGDVLCRRRLETISARA